LYGSGLRAAAAISARHPSVHFETYAGNRDKDLLAAVARSFSLDYRANDRPDDVRFHYEHPLARPEIYPPLHLLEAVQPIEVEAQCVLRFGFLEGDAIVKADRAVYDPQSAFQPRHFFENGSIADHLAIVANLREAHSLTGESDPKNAGLSLLSSERAEAVVLKCGIHGAILFSHEGISSIPSFRTDAVWPLGSGDIFSAVFAQLWGAEEIAPVVAAERASRLTALYCSNKVLPLAVDAESNSEPFLEQTSTLATSGTLKSPAVYLAGPFFSMKQRWLVRQARTALTNQGARVFSPYHNVGPGPASVVVSQDIDGLEGSDAVLALVDDLDSGTLFEVGYARAKGIPVVAFWQGDGEEAMKMLSGTDCTVCNDFTTSIYKALWAATK
jgi:nucleoside 2-deoxyribosyltransferase